jgi:drug/metabolite transporter (DMT)-like permease
MIKNPRRRRALSIALLVLGGILMFLAPEHWYGLVILVLGVLIEVLGIVVGHGEER